MALTPGATMGMPCTIREERRVQHSVEESESLMILSLAVPGMPRTQSAANGLERERGSPGDTSGRKLRCERQYRAE